jgi:hypothetical protein
MRTRVIAHHLRKDSCLSLISSLIVFKGMSPQELNQLTETKVTEVRETQLQKAKMESAPQVLREGFSVEINECEKMDLVTGEEAQLNVQLIENTNKKGLMFPSRPF